MPDVDDSIIVATLDGGLSVSFGSAQILRDARDDGGMGYRVRITGTPYILAMKFARQKDAEAAARAIVGLTDWTQNVDAIKQSSRAKGLTWRKLQQVMLEALAW